MAGRVPAIVTAVVCALVAIFLAVNARDASVLRQANEHGAAGRFGDAVAAAGRVRRAPADARALVAAARARTAAGELLAADRAWAAAARRDPNRWQVHFEWARALGVLRGDPAAAQRHYRRARALNPLLPPLVP